MKAWTSMAVLLFAACPVLAQSPPPAPPQTAIWTTTKVMHCEVLRAQSCSSDACQPAAKLPSFRIDVAKQVMCGIVAGGCRNEIKIGEVGLDGAGKRMTLHALGVAFVVGIDADGTMNGADVVRGRVVVIQGRCVPG